jgi:hypothetical protein
MQRKSGKHFWTKKEFRTLVKSYADDPLVYKLFSGRTVSSVHHKASRLKLRKSIRKSVYAVNHNFFKKWSPEMAYVLGWIFSDGNISGCKNRYGTSIHLNKKDNYILEKISEVMGSNRPVLVHSDSIYLKIDSKVLHRDLLALGCKPNKSLSLRFPNIKEKFLSHFIRGYFDGDGSIHFNKPNTIKISFVGTKEFLKELQSRVNSSLNLKINPITKVKSIWRIHYYSNDARTLCRWMYKNSGSLYLKRKMERFKKHMEIRKNDGL